MVARVNVILLLLFIAGLLSRGEPVEAADLSLVRVGLVEVDDTLFVETSTAKAMFPVAVNGHLMFVLIDDNAARAADKVYTYRVSDVLSPRSWVPKPVKVVRALEQDKDEWSEGGNAAILAIFGNGLILRRNSSQALDLVDAVSGVPTSRPPSKQGLRAFSRGNGNGDFKVTSEGLFHGDVMIFQCGEVLNVSVSGGSIAVGYLDERNAPRFALVKANEPADCREHEDDPLGFEPKLSPSGRYVGVIVPRIGESLIFDLVVYYLEGGRLEKVIQSDKVGLYDIKIYDFKYEGSISWRKEDLKEILYFKPTRSGSERMIGRIECRGGICGPVRFLQAPKCVSVVKVINSPDFDRNSKGPIPYWRHDNPPDPLGDQDPTIVWVKAKGVCGSRTANDEPRVEIASISWSVPIFDGSRWLIAAQAVIRATKTEEHSIWTSRVILLDENMQ